MLRDVLRAVRIVERAGVTVSPELGYAFVQCAESILALEDFDASSERKVGHRLAFSRWYFIRA
jgi:hypothetical protein